MAQNYHPFSPSDVCVPATVDLIQNEFTVDSSWMAGAFFLGLFLGALLTAICVPFCLKDLEKKKVSFFPLKVTIRPKYCKLTFIRDDFISRFTKEKLVCSDNLLRFKCRLSVSENIIPKTFGEVSGLQQEIFATNLVKISCKKKLVYSS